MRTILRRLLIDRRGATAVEYGLILHRRSSFPFDRLPAKRYDCDHSLSLAPACPRPSGALVCLLYTLRYRRRRRCRSCRSSILYWLCAMRKWWPPRIFRTFGPRFDELYP